MPTIRVLLLCLICSIKRLYHVVVSSEGYSPSARPPALCTALNARGDGSPGGGEFSTPSVSKRVRHPAGRFNPTWGSFLGFRRQFGRGVGQEFWNDRGEASNPQPHLVCAQRCQPRKESLQRNFQSLLEWHGGMQRHLMTRCLLFRTKRVKRNA